MVVYLVLSKARRANRRSDVRGGKEQGKPRRATRRALVSSSHPRLRTRRVTSRCGAYTEFQPTTAATIAHLLLAPLSTSNWNCNQALPCVCVCLCLCACPSAEPLCATEPNDPALHRPMTDLLHVLPDFDTTRFAHLLPSLDKALISTNDLVTLEPTNVAKRAQVPAGELRKLVDALVPALHHHLGFGAEEPRSTAFLSASGHASAPRAISTLDDELDQALRGGIRPGYLVEVTGERYLSNPYCLSANIDTC